jgi:hypothetical protein
LGRDELVALPNTTLEHQWSAGQEATVGEADSLFGDQKWRKYILNSQDTQSRQKWFIALYRANLLKWFRYVLAMPFAPKKGQLFHLVLCSNYEVGVKMTKDLYASKTGNPAYLPGRSPYEKAYAMFRKAHPEIVTGRNGRRKPLAWRILWRTIKYHEGGICDHMCKDFEELEPSTMAVKTALNWLHSKGYINPINAENAWQYPITRYMLNWKTITSSLNVGRQPSLKPISPEKFAEFQWRKIADLFKTEKEGE